MCLLLSCAQLGKIVSWLVEGTSGVGHKTDLSGTPYSLSEDFVSSYRMHPLLPDDFFIAGDEVGLFLLYLSQGFTPCMQQQMAPRGLTSTTVLVSLRDFVFPISPNTTYHQYASQS